MPTKRSQEFMDLKHGNDKKASKPLMEKRRRARINHSLAQLKSLVIDPNTTERSRQAKLEKADILELTVRHLHEIKRRQRTASLLDSGHPKKKFEMGYSECVREVELFLTNLMDSQLIGIEPELQKRLKDHLSRRLQDLNNIEPLPEYASTQDMVDQSSANTSPNNSSSVAVNNSQNPSTLVVNVENYHLKDIPINTYPENKRKYRKSPDHAAFDAPMTDMQVSSSKGCSFSLPSSQPTDMPQRMSQSSELSISSEMDGYQYNPTFVKHEKELPNLVSFQSPQPRDLSCSKTKASNDSFGQIPNFVSNDSSENSNQRTFDINKTSTSYNSDNLEDSYRQIPLAPRRLPNGEWALVLPGNMSLSEIEGQSPLSAFRLVWPSVCPEVDHDLHKMRQQYVVSPLSSSVSDMSCEDYCPMADGEAAVKVEQDSMNEGIRFVWRPW